MKLIYSNITGMEYDMNFVRRDPSPVIKVGNRYYIYYSKNTTKNGFNATIWYAFSDDGKHWTEGGMAVGKGEGDAFDAGGVFTPTTLLADGYIYLFYTATRADFQFTSTEANGLTAIGLAKSKSPTGPFEKICDEPLLRTGNGESFDSHRIDDTCIVVHNGKYYMFYKGRQLHLSPKETKMGLAIAEKPEGPYIKYENNPVINSGHEVCVYPNNGGFMALITNIGEYANSYMYSKNGIDFKKLGDLAVPQSIGPYREDGYNNNECFKLKWGVFHDYIDKWAYIRRFDVEY